MNIIDMNRHQTQSESNLDVYGWLQRREGKRYADFHNLESHLRERSRAAKAKVIDNRKIELLAHPEPSEPDHLNQLLVSVDGDTVGMTHWSFTNLCQRAGVPTDFMRKLPGALVKDNIEYALRHIREVEEIKPYYDGQQLRAITGPNYGRVDDWQFVNAIKKITEGTGFVPATGHMGLRCTDRSLQLFLIDKANPIVVGKTRNGDDDVLYRGLRGFNSELGFSSMGADVFHFRSYCENGMIFGKQNFESNRIRHTKNAAYRWSRELQPALEAYAQEDGSKLVDQVERVKAINVATDEESAVEWMRKRGATAKLAKEAYSRVQIEEGRNARTVWDMVQGMTAAARSIVEVEERVAIETLAGDIWQRAAA